MGKHKGRTSDRSLDKNHDPAASAAEENLNLMREYVRLTGEMARFAAQTANSTVEGVEWSRRNFIVAALSGSWTVGKDLWHSDGSREAAGKAREKKEAQVTEWARMYFCPLAQNAS